MELISEMFGDVKIHDANEESMMEDPINQTFVFSDSSNISDPIYTESETD